MTVQKMAEPNEVIMNNRELAKQAVDFLTAKKARDIVAIDVAERSSFADWLILASAGSERQLGALASELADALAEKGLFVRSVEGKKPSGWILMDYGDLIVNLFSEEQRGHYNLEKIWGDGTFVDLAE